MSVVKIRIVGNSCDDNKGFVTCRVNARTSAVKEHLPGMGILKYEHGEIVLSETLPAGSYEYHIISQKGKDSFAE